MKIMLSYNQKSSGDLVRRINQELKTSHFETWIDIEQMFENCIEKMAEAVETSDVVLVFVTKEYCESEFCLKEINYAFKKKKIIIPVKVNKWFDPSGVVGIIVAELIFVDFFEKDFNESFNKLLNQINKCSSKNLSNSSSQAYENRSKSRFSEIDYRFSLKMGDNDYIFYNGNKKWIHSKNDNNLETYREIQRNSNAIRLASDKNPENCIELKDTDNLNIPKWCSVWKKKDKDIYFYPMSDTLWIEIQNENVFSRHKFLKKIDNVPFFKREDGLMYLKLSNALYWGQSLENIIHKENEGEWINN